MCLIPNLLDFNKCKDWPETGLLSLLLPQLLYFHVCFCASGLYLCVLSTLVGFGFHACFYLFCFLHFCLPLLFVVHALIGSPVPCLPVLHPFTPAHHECRLLCLIHMRCVSLLSQLICLGSFRFFFPLKMTFIVSLLQSGSQLWKVTVGVTSGPSLII